MYVNYDSIKSPVVSNITPEALRQYLMNRNAFTLLSHKDSNIHKPTHFVLASDFYDDTQLNRAGYKITLRPYDISDFLTKSQELILETAKHNGVLNMIKGHTNVTE